MRSPCDTNTLEQIKGYCKLGGKDVDGKTYVERLDPILHGKTDRMKRVARRRYLEFAGQTLPENLKLQTLLEHWVSRGILHRLWKIGPCHKCNQHYFVATLNIQRSIMCANCGHRINLPAEVPIGYAVNRAVAHAIREGLTPVVQTGRFLKGMTDHGFLWLPGVKYKMKDVFGDVDLLASCDGHLVFCECKKLEGTPGGAKVWDDVVAQFVETARVAKSCRGSLVVLASRVSEYPKSVQRRLKRELGSSIPYLLLNREDLEKGYRPITRNNLETQLALGDVLPTPFPEKPMSRSGGPRTINMGWGVFTS